MKVGSRRQEPSYSLRVRRSTEVDMVPGGRLSSAGGSAGLGAAVLGGRVANRIGKYGAPDQNIRRAEHGGSRHMTH